MKSIVLFVLSLLVAQAGALATSAEINSLIVDSKRATKKSAVTWDENSFFIHGERLMLFCGEFHPFRLPVPSLWLDVLQKIKSMGFNCVSFYADWALLEGNPGEYRDDGVFDVEPFLQAAQEAGLYVIARPGPYINAEVSGGGFPGWLTRLKGALRTTAPDYLAATDNFMARICKTIADYQITRGGPVILVQPENEWTNSAVEYMPFPQGEYMQYVMDQATKAGIEVPFINNDAAILGRNRPGTGVGEVDIYGYDTYPMGFDCSQPSKWPHSLGWNLWDEHLEWSPSTPHSVLEFQGGVFDRWGGTGYGKCVALVNHEFARVFIKNNFAQGVKLLNLYMTYGGTNWGNIGDPALYTSYDYASSIAEDRSITREKYSELKLQATFMTSSPEYLTAIPQGPTTGVYCDDISITVTPITGNGTSVASFYMVRHTDYTSTATTNYTLSLPTAQGNITIPHDGNTLSIIGRDSKLMVTNYGTISPKLLYSTADVLTYGKFGKQKILVLYAPLGEFNELAIEGNPHQVKQVGRGGDYKVQKLDAPLTKTDSTSYVTIGWQTPEDRTILQIGEVTLILLNRNSAYNYWITDASGSNSRIIVNGPYLVRNASLSHGILSLSADFNATTPIEVIGAPAGVKKLLVNDKAISFESRSGVGLTAQVNYSKPNLEIPDLTSLDWKYIDTLPEIRPDYDDSKWPNGDHPFTNNTLKQFWTPVSLYAGDYGFHSGTNIYRAHFNSTGNEDSFALWVAGGYAFSSALWLGDQFISSYSSNVSSDNYPHIYNLSSISFDKGQEYVFTAVILNNGLDHSWIGQDEIKAPRGILGWNLLTSKRTSTSVTWKLTGNFKGEDYPDLSRGPLNEGGLFVERNGFHLPNAPTSSWSNKSPSVGLETPGIEFYTSTFELDLPSDDWDIPLAISFSNDTATNGRYRGQLYINGWQYGRFSHMGPQYEFYVPEGILNYKGENTIGVSLWALEEHGASIESIKIQAGQPVWTGRQAVQLVKASDYTKREGAY